MENELIKDMPKKTAPMFTIRQMKEIARARLKGKWKKAAVPVTVYLLLVLLPAVMVELLSTLYPEESAGGVLGTVESLVSIYVLLVSGGFVMSLAALGLRIIRDQEFDSSITFEGFRNKYTQSFFTYFLTEFFKSLWMVLFMMPGIIVISAGMVGYAENGTVDMNSAADPEFLATSGNFMITAGLVLVFAGLIGAAVFCMRYEMSYFAASDDRNMRASAAVKSSVDMMKGYVWKMFLLNLSFIGWALLASIPFGAGAAIISAFPLSVLSVAGGILLMAAGCVTLGVVMLYMQTASAVFYSGISGKFHAAEPEAEESTGEENL